MSNKTLGLPDDVHAYLIEHGVREPELLTRLRAETAQMPNAQMQIAPEQGAFMGWLVETLGVRRALELGTFTGYSSLAVALAMPDDGRITCLDISKEYTDVARRYWREAGVEHKVDLRLGLGAGVACGSQVRGRGRDIRLRIPRRGQGAVSGLRRGHP